MYKTISHSLLSRSGNALIQSFLEQKCCTEALLLRTLKSPFMEVPGIYRGARNLVKRFYFPSNHPFYSRCLFIHAQRQNPLQHTALSRSLLQQQNNSIKLVAVQGRKIFIKYVFLAQPSRQVACSFWAVCQKREEEYRCSRLGSSRADRTALIEDEEDSTHRLGLVFTAWDGLGEFFIQPKTEKNPRKSLLICRYQ